jgi:hypothetical protein
MLWNFLKMMVALLTKAKDLPRASERQLAQFITNQLATLGDGSRGEEAYDQHTPVSFDKLNLLDKRDTIIGDNGQERYNPEFLSRYSPDERNIYLNFAMPAENSNNRRSMNPLSKLIHEGTHALDDLYIHPQRAAIDRLKKMHDKAGNPKDVSGFLKPIYEQTQEILPSNSFRNLYSYEAYGKPKLEDNFKNIKKKFQHPRAFLNAQNSLNQPDIDSTLFAEPFTEFTAHGIQNLHQPWDISENSENINDGRSFLKSMIKESYRNSQELDPEFSTNYPAANQLFLDRISQLRNYKKYPTSNDYLQKRGNTLTPGYMPQYSPRYNQNANSINMQMDPAAPSNLQNIAVTPEGSPHDPYRGPLDPNIRFQ